MGAWKGIASLDREGVALDGAAAVEGRGETPPAPPPVPARRALDADSRELAQRTCTPPGRRSVRRRWPGLHALLLRAARFEITRRRGMLPHLRGDAFEDIAVETADDALMAVAPAPRRLPGREPLSRPGPTSSRLLEGGG